MSDRFFSVVLLMLLVLSALPVLSQVPVAGSPFPAGAKVEVKYNGSWYPAKVKEVRGRDRWFISYDGYGSSSIAEEARVFQVIRGRM